MAGCFFIPKSVSRAATAVILGASIVTATLTVACDSGRQPQKQVKGREIKEPAGANRITPMREAALRQKQLEFLHRMRVVDPHFHVVDQAVMNERNELGVVLNAYVALDDVPALMRLILTKMAAEFPDQSLAVVAYAPSMPRTKLGTGRLDVGTHRLSFSWAIRVPMSEPESESPGTMEI